MNLKVAKITTFFFLENVYEFCSPENSPLLKRFLNFQGKDSPYI